MPTTSKGRGAVSRRGFGAEAVHSLLTVTLALRKCLEIHRIQKRVFNRRDPQIYSKELHRLCPRGLSEPDRHFGAKLDLGSTLTALLPGRVRRGEGVPAPPPSGLLLSDETKGTISIKLYV